MSLATRTLTALTLAAVTAAVAPAPARADSASGYVCSTYLNPQAGNFGSYGWMMTSVYSGPSCSGTFLRQITFCTTGATAPTCDSAYLFREPALYALYGSLIDATIAGLHVLASIKPGAGGGQFIWLGQ